MGATESEPLHVLVTMDCLPPEGPDPVPGPTSWEAARRSVESFCEGLTEAGLKGTFFIAPECLKRLKDTVGSLRAAGMELGVLCHPQLSNYQSYLGSYGFDRQREVVRLDKTVWQDKLGEAPDTFRAGYFSVNDYTYHVLCLEGFSQGSCCLPGRIDPDQCCMWQKVYPFPHHTDPLDRTIAGTMEFYEAPVTSEFTAKEFVKAETYTPPHLRIEEPRLGDYAERLVRRQIERMQEDRTQVRSIVLVTQNTVRWGAGEDPHLERLSNLSSMLRRAAEQCHMRLAPTTLKGMHEFADSLVKVPPA